MGGCVVAQIYEAVATHLVNDPALAEKNQPDVLNLHLDFLRACVRDVSTITITTLKAGAAASFLQVHLYQKDALKVVALATSTNFDVTIGPSAPTNWALNPPPKPKPDFGRIVAHKPDDNWLPSSNVGEVFAFTKRMYTLNPRGGHPVDGICDAWNGFQHEGDERMDATYVALLSDILPSMPDTLLRNNGLYDAHTYYKRMEEWAEKNPGKPALIPNSLADAKKSKTFSATQTLDLEFKRRMPKDGQKWMFTRTTTKMMEKGRTDVHLTMLNEDMELVAMARQVILVLEAQRKFRDEKKPRAVL